MNTGINARSVAGQSKTQRGADINKVLQNDYRAYTPKPFLEEDRQRTTLLFGGLTWRAERALEGVLQGSGYVAQALPTATRSDLLRGRELADVGQCCPTAFTVGNLANFLLRDAERRGVSKTTQDYAYFTAGSCGSCRFGQYHQSYELALANIGMSAFRLFLVKQGDPTALQDGDGLRFSLDLLSKAILAILARSFAG